MSKKRKMPVNVLQNETAQAAGDSILEELVTARPANAAVPVNSVSGDLMIRHSTGCNVSVSVPLRERVEQRRLARAQGDVRSWALFSALIGLVPVLFLAFVLVVVVQMKMIDGLSDRYEIFFPRDRLKRLGLCMLGGIMAWIGYSVLTAVLFSGGLFGIVWLGLSAWGSTYWVGKVFIKHFEAGETLLDLDPTSMKDYFRKKYGEEPG